ncbi:hypothetical protein ALC62_14576, partial [Cyphomyrmex costatus]
IRRAACRQQSNIGRKRTNFALVCSEKLFFPLTGLGICSSFRSREIYPA